MTEKAEQILLSALELFVANGYDGTTTLQIAKNANVSEGLIFRHFENKAGLLKAIVKHGQELVSKPINDILEETNPKAIITKTIDLPLIYYQEKSRYWKLLIDFKSKNKSINDQMHSEARIDLLHAHLQKAFEDIGVENAKSETDMVYVMIFGVSMLIYNEDQFEICSNTINYLKQKYKVNS